jgi:hypothetical protein
MPDPYNLSEQIHIRMEQARRIGFAKGQIREAMGYIDGRLPDRTGNSHLYWAYKALCCALEELDRPILMPDQGLLCLGMGSSTAIARINEIGAES